MANKTEIISKIELPIPPSTNQLFRARQRGRRGHFYKSRVYMDWIKEVSLTVPRGKPIEGLAEIAIEIHGGTGWTHRRDLDNTNKAVIDLLKNKSYIHDDNTKHVRKITTSYHAPSLKNARAICVVYISHLKF